MNFISIPPQVEEFKMQYIDSHENKCTKDCLKELAEILARGYLRLKKRTPYIPELAEENRLPRAERHPSAGDGHGGAAADE